jgi:hypothetical protein
MLVGRIAADLPSAEQPGAAPGDDAFAPTHDRLAFGTSQVLKLIRDALVAADLRDLASLSIDGRDVYRDIGGAAHDEIDELLERAAELGLLLSSFREIGLVLFGEDDSARHVVDLRVRSQVPAGEPELVARTSTRPKRLDVRAGESAKDYVSRLDAMFRDPESLASLRADAASMQERVAAAMRATLEGATVSTSEVRLAIVRPTREDLDHIGGVGFGPMARPARYALADTPREPRWADPAIAVVEDDYVVLRNLIALDALLAAPALREPWVSVTDPSGKLLFAGTAARNFEDMPWRRHFTREWAGNGVVVRWTAP